MRFFRAVTSLLILLTTVVAVVWWRTSASALKPPSVDYVARIDLAPQKFGEIVTAKLRITNRGGSPLELNKFRTSCSCAGVELFQDNRWKQVSAVRLIGGESIELAIRISVGATPGTAQNVTVSFNTNDPNHPEAIVDVRIPRVTSDVYTDPAAVIFGVLQTGDSVERTITIYDCGIAGRKVTNVSCRNPERFDVRVLPEGTPLPAIEHLYAGNAIAQVTITPQTSKPGTLNSEVVIEWSDTQTARRLIPITGEVVGSIDVNPSVLYLPKVSQGQLRDTASVRLVSRANKPITVVLEKVPNDLTVNVSKETATTIILTITCSKIEGSSKQSPRQSVIHARVQDEKSTALVEIPIYHP